MLLGERIKELRAEHGVLQRQLAALLEIDTPMFSKRMGDISQRIEDSRPWRNHYRRN